MEFTLSMTFLTSTGEKATMSVSDVKENLTQEEAVALMDAIIANDIFETSKGNTTYSKKSFSGVKDGADPEKVYAVADAIKGVLGANTRYYYLTEVSLLKSE